MAKKDYSTTCHYVGCNCKATYKMQMNWGKPGGLHLTCDEHAPEWAKAGEKQSPPAEIFGQVRSWYTLIEKL